VNLAIVYLLYPSVSATVFTLFRCRKVSPEFSLLEVDYAVQCYTGTHAVFLGVGSLFVLLYPVGVPLSVGIVLWRTLPRVSGPPRNRSWGPGKTHCL
jgi:hypothetical protein